MSSLEQELRGQIAALNDELDNLLYAVSHDVRAPLRSLNGFSTALEEDYTDVLDDQGRDYLMRIKRAAAKAEEYMQALLLVSRTTREALRPQTVNLTELAHTLHAGAAEHFAHALTLNASTPLTATLDRQMAQAMLAALMDNAWKFTANVDDPTLSLTMELTEHGPALVLADNGEGFDPVQLKGDVFGMFQRMHGDEYPGLGCGLALVRRIVSRHGGRAWIESRPNAGTTVYLLLPELAEARESHG